MLTYTQEQQLKAYQQRAKGADPVYNTLPHISHPSRCDEPFHRPLSSYSSSSSSNALGNKKNENKGDIRSCASTLHKTHNVCLECIQRSSSAEFLLPSSRGILERGCLARLCSGCCGKVRFGRGSLVGSGEEKGGEGVEGERNGGERELKDEDGKGKGKGEEKEKEEGKKRKYDGEGDEKDGVKDSKKKPEGRGKEINTCTCPFGWESPHSLPQLIDSTGKISLPKSQKWHCHECRATLLWRAATSRASWEERLRHGLGEVDPADDELYLLEGTICPLCRVHFGFWIRRDDMEQWRGDSLLFDFGERGWTKASLRCPDKRCLHHVSPLANEEELKMHTRDAHGWCPDGDGFACLCLACEGIVWRSKGDRMESTDLSYKFMQELEEATGFRVPDWTGQSLGHRVLPGEANVSPRDLKPQDPKTDVSGLVLDTSSSNTLPSLPLEWGGLPRRPGASTIYPDASGYERNHLDLGTLQRFKIARDFVVKNARDNPEEGCWNCGRMGHHDDECQDTFQGQELDNEIENMERRRDATIGRPDLLYRDA